MRSYGSPDVHAVSKPKCFFFGPFEVNQANGRLNRNGVEISLRPKAFEMLVYLLDNAGRLIPRKELLDAVWPGVVVTDDSISQCLIELRKALDDGDRTIIKTVPRRGLIFELPVKVVDQDSPLASNTSVGKNGAPWKWIALLAICVPLVLVWIVWQMPVAKQGPEPNQSIAVLRFADMSPPPGHAYLAEGLSEEILHLLAGSPSLDVIARASSFAFQGQPADEVGRALGVNYVLEGSVRRQGDQLRITAKLIDVKTSTHVWSRAYDRQLSNIIDTQRDIAEDVSHELHASLGEAISDTTANVRNHELFLEAKYLFTRRTESSLESAQARLEEILEFEPGNARAWALLADVLANRLHDPELPGRNEAGRESLVSKEQFAIEQALKYGPNLPEAHHLAARRYFYTGDREKALLHLERVRSIDPDHRTALIAMAHDLRNDDQVELAGQLMRRLVNRDPLDLALRSSLITDLFYSARYMQVRSHFEILRDLVPARLQKSTFVNIRVVQADILRSDFSVAREVIQQMPDGFDRSLASVLLMGQVSGGPEAATALASLELAANSELEMVRIAEIYAYRNEAEKALDWLNQVELGTDCLRDSLWQAVYYSPFLSMLKTESPWPDIRSSALDRMRACRLGLKMNQG